MLNVFGSLLFLLPMLAVLITSLVVIATRRDRIGPRAARFGLAGLAVLLVTTIAQTAWSASLPLLMDALHLQVTQLGLIASIVGLIFSCATALAVGLLIAAVVTRSATPAPQPVHQSETAA